MDPILFVLPWVGVGLFIALVFRSPRALAGGALENTGDAPFVSVIVPARNEEANIEACLSSLAEADYPAFEVLVVDDRSEDRTAELAEELARKHPDMVRLIHGKPLPEGWFGKPWACWQGAVASRGDLLLFTDADTVHSGDLLGKAVAGIMEENSDALTVIGHQVMDSFWEQVVQPQFFMLLAGRFPTAGIPKKPHQWRHAIANGQYLLFTRSAYEKCGGHEAVAGEVVEDMRLAQILVRGGWKLVVRGGKGLRTRMYQSLADLVEGWSKNVSTAVLQSTAPWLLPIIHPLSLVVGTTLWLLPPVVLIWSLLTGVSGTTLTWAAVSTGLSVLIWMRVSAMMKGNALYGFLYPLGAVIGEYIFLKSWRRGTHIVWKGRSYEMPQVDRVGPPSPLGSVRAKDHHAGSKEDD